MKQKRKLLLDDTSGFTLIELLLVVLVFAIMIVPVYKILVSGAKIQKTSEETYQATLQAQSVLESVKGQIEKDIAFEQKVNRGLATPPVAKWLSETPSGATDRYLLSFLQGDDFTTLANQADPNVKKLRKAFKTDTFLYEVHIWPIVSGGISPLPISMIEYDPTIVPAVGPPNFGVSGETPADFTMVDLNAAMNNYFDHKTDALSWTKPAALENSIPAELEAEKLKGVGIISYDETLVGTNGGIKIQASGIVESSPSTPVGPIPDYSGFQDKAKISYKLYTSGTEGTYEFVIDDLASPVGGKLTEQDYIYLTVDLATFPYEPVPVPPATYDEDADERILRIENKTAATVVVPIYNEKDLGIKIFPVQHQTKGNIIIERRDKREPGKNFVIGVIVRDAFNSTFGKPNKVLSKIVDVYSYDYNKK